MNKSPMNRIFKNIKTFAVKPINIFKNTTNNFSQPIRIKPANHLLLQPSVTGINRKISNIVLCAVDTPNIRKMIDMPTDEFAWMLTCKLVRNGAYVALGLIGLAASVLLLFIPLIIFSIFIAPPFGIFLALIILEELENKYNKISSRMEIMFSNLNKRLMQNIMATSQFQQEFLQ
jgi:hypothetical protein